MKLKGKKLVSYQGKVVDLYVRNSHTYNVESLAVHNSGGGSLMLYVLYVTELDPIRWNLPFGRFLSKFRTGMADVDCVHENHFVVMSDGSYKRIGDVVVGERILGGDGLPHAITATYRRKLRYGEDAVWVTVRASDGTLGNLLVVPGHKFVLEDKSVVYCRDLKIGAKLLGTVPTDVVGKLYGGFNSSLGDYIDVTVEDDHMFNIIPFNVETYFDDQGFETLTRQIGY